jgi:DNA-binding protein YbaB
MTTRQNEIRRILKKLNGSEPDDALVSRLANAAEAAEISPNDALFAPMIAFNIYRDMLFELPKQLDESVNLSLRRFNQELNQYTSNAEKKLSDAAKETFTGLLSKAHNDAVNAVKVSTEKAVSSACDKELGSKFEVFDLLIEKAKSIQHELKPSNQIYAISVASFASSIVTALIFFFLFGNSSAPEKPQAELQNEARGAAMVQAFEKLDQKTKDKIEAAMKGDK